MNVKLLGASILCSSLLLFSCTKQEINSELRENPTSTRSAVDPLQNASKISSLAGDGGYNKKYKVVISKEEDNTVTISYDCSESGNNCKVTKNGIEVKFPKKELKALKTSIGLSTVPEFFQSADWEILFPEFKDSEILEKLRNGQLTIWDKSEFSRYNSFFIITRSDVNPNNISESQVVLAAAFE